MTPERRLACLAALGVDVYVRRPPQGVAGAAVVAEVTPRPATAARTPHVDLAPGHALPVAASETAAGNPAVAGLDWEPLETMVSGCTRCALCQTRTKTVFGTGDRRARWMFIGEAPGADEDRQGEPFVGRAGQLLTSMIRAIGLRREDVYIANVVKCRPPGNRDPKPEEVAQCRGYLERQIELVEPAIVVAVGRIAAQNLLATEVPLARLRGRLHALGPRGWPVVVTYHPAYLLRSPGEKRKVWQDLLFARQQLAGLESAGRSAP
jgi:DNA polymerase